MNFIFNELYKLPETEALCKAIEKNTLLAALTGLSHIQKIILTAVTIKKLGIKPLIIAEDDSVAEHIVEDFFNLGFSAILFPSRDYNLRSSVTESHELERQRIGALIRILDEDFDVAVCTASAASGVTVPPSALIKRSFSLTDDKLAPIVK